MHPTLFSHGGHGTARSLQRGGVCEAHISSRDRKTAIVTVAREGRKKRHKRRDGVHARHRERRRREVLRRCPTSGVRRAVADVSVLIDRGKRGRERGPWSDEIIGYPAGGGETPRGERTRREERKFVGRHTMSRRFESRGAVREVHPDEIIGYESQIPMGSSLGRRVRRDSNRASLCSVRRSFFRFSARAGFFFMG